MPKDDQKITTDSQDVRRLVDRHAQVAHIQFGHAKRKVVLKYCQAPEDVANYLAQE